MYSIKVLRKQVDYLLSRDPDYTEIGGSDHAKNHSWHAGNGKKSSSVIKPDSRQGRRDMYRFVEGEEEHLGPSLSLDRNFRANSHVSQIRTPNFYARSHINGLT